MLTFAAGKICWKKPMHWWLWNKIQIVQDIWKPWYLQIVRSSYRFLHIFQKVFFHSYKCIYLMQCSVFDSYLLDMRNVNKFSYLWIVFQIWKGFCCRDLNHKFYHRSLKSLFWNTTNNKQIPLFLGFKVQVNKYNNKSVTYKDVSLTKSHVELLNLNHETALLRERLSENS